MTWFLTLNPLCVNVELTQFLGKKVNCSKLIKLPQDSSNRDFSDIVEVPRSLHKGGAKRKRALRTERLREVLKVMRR